MNRACSFLAGALFLATPAVAKATMYEVGPNEAVKSPCALFANTTLAAGDVVLVDAGTYNDACQVTQSGAAGNPIVMKGAAGPRPVFDPTGIDLSGSGSTPRAVFQFTGGSHWLVQHLELKNASGSSGNGAAFRVTAGSDDITIEDMSIHDCQDGIMGDGSGAADIESSEIFHNGANDGQTHNLYMQNDHVRLFGNSIHDSNGGQNVKMRAHYVELLYNFIANAGNYEIDLIQGPLTGNANANVAMIGNVVVRNPNAANDGQTIVWGSDNPGQTGRNGSLYAINNTFVLTASTNRLFNAISAAPGSQIHLWNNIIHATVSGTGISTGAATDAILDGTNNWVTTGITAPAGLTGSVGGADPGFVSMTDLHLKVGAPAIDKGTAMLSYMDGSGMSQDGTPKFETSVSGGAFATVTRLADGTLDLGAYEYGTPADGGVTPPDAGGPAGDAGPFRDAGGGGTGDGGGGGGNGDGGGNGAAPGSSGSSGGCGCRVGPAGSSAGAGVLVGLLLGIAIGRRRRAGHPPYAA